MYNAYKPGNAYAAYLFIFLALGIILNINNTFCFPNGSDCKLYGVVNMLYYVFSEHATTRNNFR